MQRSDEASTLDVLLQSAVRKARASSVRGWLKSLLQNGEKARSAEMAPAGASTRPARQSHKARKKLHGVVMSNATVD